MFRNRAERRTILLGAVLGAVAGCALALVWSRRSRQGVARRPVQMRQLARLGAALVPVVRQLLDLMS